MSGRKYARLVNHLESQGRARRGGKAAWPQHPTIVEFPVGTGSEVDARQYEAVVLDLTEWARSGVKPPPAVQSVVLRRYLTLP